MRLNQLDLNLFKVFEAIYQERNLTRAAQILSLSQPAVSNALSRLRKSFNDPLFVRTPQGMVPTPVAQNIALKSQQALQLLNSCVQEGNVFDPAQAKKEFCFSMNDTFEALLLPPLLVHMQKQAPGISVACFAQPRSDVSKSLASGELDFVVDVPVLNDPNLCHQHLSSEKYVCAVRLGHPAITQGLSLQQYLALAHIHVSSRRKGVGHVDRALNVLGVKRNIQLRLQHSLAAPRLIRSTDLCCSMPAVLAKTYGLVCLELPFEVEQIDWHLYWHKSSDEDQGNAWVRQALFELVGNI